MTRCGSLSRFGDLFAYACAAVAVASGGCDTSARSGMGDGAAADGRTGGPDVVVVMRDAAEAETDVLRDIDAAAASDGAADAAALPADGSARDTGHATQANFGVLQFRVDHNLTDERCLGQHECSLTTEPLVTEDWVQELRSHATHGTFHWDRAIPWLVFAQSPPEGADRVAFYDARLDAELLGWLNGFVAAFRDRGAGYAAVSILDGTRDRIAPAYLGPDIDPVALSEICGSLAPGTRLSVDHPSVGGVSFDVAEAYGNLVLYVHDKLTPRYLALLVEANAFRRLCPAQWPGLVALYAALHDRVRAEVEPETRLFATLTYLELLGYDYARCHGRLASGSCSAPAEPLAADTQRCFPLDRQPILDLDRGGRMDLLALSFYPDALLMRAPGLDDASVDLHAVDEVGNLGACANRLGLAQFIDPLAQLDRLEWDRPIAFSEWSARSCPTTAWFSPGEADQVGRLPATPASQAFWMERFVQEVSSGRLEFTNYSFLRDYPPIGPWVVRRGVMTSQLFGLLNSWPCSGIYTESGQPKGRVTQLWEDAPFAGPQS